MKKFESIYIDGLESYINNNLIERPFPIMSEMEEFASKNKIPILSPATGSILKFLIQIHRPNHILELGTGLGYSTAWMLSSGTKCNITTLDRNERELTSASNFLSKLKTPFQNIEFLHSHCIEFLKNSTTISDFNLIFVDCDKVCYPEILEIILNKANSNTIILFDNVLWHGRLDESKFSKPSDKAIQEFWKIIKSNSKINYTLFPSGDGLLQMLL